MFTGSRVSEQFCLNCSNALATIIQTSYVMHAENELLLGRCQSRCVPLHPLLRHKMHTCEFPFVLYMPTSLRMCPTHSIDMHIAQAVRKGWAAYHAWAPVLASTRIHVATKKRLIDTHVRPSMEYALEIWSTPLVSSDAASLQPLDVVLTAACRLACGVRASPAMHAWERRAGVKPDVLLADMGELPMQDVALIATLRYAERVRVADTGAAALTQHDDGSPAFETALPAHKSPDFMHAALRRALPPDDAWVCRVAAARAAVRAELGTTAPAPGRRLNNDAIRGAIAARRRAQWVRSAPAATAAVVTARGRASRPVHAAPPLLCPLRSVLASAAVRPRYLHAPESAVLCILMLRSAHLPGDFCPEARALYNSDMCMQCGGEVLTVRDSSNMDERRWRHVQHVLLECEDCFACRPRPSQLRADLLRSCRGHAASVCAVEAAFPPGEASPSCLRSTAVPYMLDPAAACPGPRAVRLAHVALVAAYIELVGAVLCARPADTHRLSSMHVPAGSAVRSFWFQRDSVPPAAPARPSPPSASRAGTAELCPVRPALQVRSPLRSGAPAQESDDEVWFYDDPCPPSPPVFAPVLSHPRCVANGTSS